METTRPKISVIIPCYKATESLDRLYESIQSQTFKDAEWIFINDGDASQNDKLNSLAEKDSCISVVWKENGGCSSARNVGIEKARGEWLVPVDADDSLQPFYLERLYSAVKDSDADLAVGGNTEIKAWLNQETQCFIDIEGEMAVDLEPKEALRKIIMCNLAVYATNKIYKLSLIRENNLRFEPSILVCEDGVFNMQYYCLCKKISLVKDCGYMYYLYDKTSLVSVYHPDYARYLMEFTQKFLKVLETHGFTPSEISELKLQREFGCVIAILFNSFRRNHPPFRKQVKEVREYVLNNKDLISAVKEYRKRHKLCMMERVIVFSIGTGSETFIALMLRCAFWVRYNHTILFRRTRDFLLRKR